MKAKTKKLTVDLTSVELQLLLQSLTHCLATCKNKSAKGGTCADCDAAKALKTRLEKVAAS
jgi:hypothetical protein